MNVVLWVLQVLLAAAFFAHGWLLLWPPPDIAADMNASLPRGFWLLLGAAEIAAAVGLILPRLTRVLPWLVAWAAGGIVIVMVSATIWHIARGEWMSSAITFVLLLMAAFVAFKRRSPRPPGPRSALN